MATFHVGQKTHQTVLPQRPALEFASADIPGNRDETGRVDRDAVPGVEHVRGETLDASPGVERVTPDPEVGEKAREGHSSREGQPMVFVIDKHGHPLQPTSPARARKLLAKGSGKFNVRTAYGTVQGIHHRHVHLLQRADGYAYTTRKEAGVASPA
ncbi:RRXRR protein [Nocardiopsis sp. Huas11]|uniref:RRXRR domain-containing protein n=1 Tax=Nocardiopsis sp. Huas11 TaxID=2183912 RepID=UPI000EB5913A|nr:RRXRR domain-containing protein [Nocardiopsis sp. Huas11]RKS06104.1 RRXRR protein [Nocardiopsis sp. Huas11]